MQGGIIPESFSQSCDTGNYLAVYPSGSRTSFVYRCVQVLQFLYQSAQRLPNRNTLITEGSDGRLIEVTPDHESVWEYINPYFNTILGKLPINMIYRLTVYPMSRIPQVEKPQEISVEKINVETFRVPGSLTGNQLGKITVIEGVDPNARLMTGGGAGEDEDEEINFCVATVRKSDLVK